MSTPNVTQVDAQKLLQALSSYAGRIAKTDDPKEHQKAGTILQHELKGSRIKA